MQRRSQYGMRTHTVAVTKQNKNVSTGLIHFEVSNFFLRAFTLVLILINKAPSKPPIIPIPIAKGNILKTLIGIPESSFPNLTLAPDQSSKLFFIKPFSIAIVKTERQQERKTFQII